ncbi:MAG: hypothetical protein K2I42_00690 [Anaeroplasmataceae bacterium]|nr:hypothetical protein [Anaeroplasmataceae bacterium]
MKKVLILANDISYLKMLNSNLDKNKYNVIEGHTDYQHCFTYCLGLSVDVILIHQSFLKNYALLNQLVCTNRFLIIYLSSKNDAGSLYSIMNNSRFYFLNDLKYYCINEIIDIMLKDNNIIYSLELEKEKYLEKIEEEKWVKKAKVLLIKKGLTEDDSYKLILKKSMNERITKKLAAKKIIEEEGF